MSLPEKIKTTTELKALQLEEKALQAQKTTRQASLEHLQEKAEKLVMESDIAKKSVEEIGFEGGELL
jgi:Fe-S cluster assembly ATPase SufC